MTMKKGLGRSRDVTGKIVSLHLNDYVNCIHTKVESGFLNMQVLIVEIYDVQANDKADLWVS